MRLAMLSQSKVCNDWADTELEPWVYVALGVIVFETSSCCDMQWKYQPCTRRGHREHLVAYWWLECLLAAAWPGPSHPVGCSFPNESGVDSHVTKTTPLHLPFGHTYLLDSLGAWRQEAPALNQKKYRALPY